MFLKPEGGMLSLLVEFFMPGTRNASFYFLFSHRSLPKLEGPLSRCWVKTEIRAVGPIIFENDNLLLLLGLLMLDIAPKVSIYYRPNFRYIVHTDLDIPGIDISNSIYRNIEISIYRT